VQHETAPSRKIVSQDFPKSSRGSGVSEGSASCRVGIALPGRARLVQVERPTDERPGPGGRGLVAFGARRAAASWRPCFQGARVPGRVALAAGGPYRVRGPEALPAGGVVVAEALSGARTLTGRLTRIASAVGVAAGHRRSH